MKNKNLLLVLMLGIVVGFSSCEKKSFTDKEQGNIKDVKINADKSLQTVENFIYYLDDKEVSKETADSYTNKTKESFIIQTEKLNKTTGKIVNLVYIYTNKEGYIAYGERHNIKLKEELTFAEHMRNYAEKSGAIAEYEKTEKVPESYLKYEKEYYKKVFGKNNSAKAYYELFVGKISGEFIGVPYFWMLATIGKMKNRVSSVWDIGPGACITLYDKTFFRGYLATHIFTPLLSSWYLPSSIDNRAESVVTH